MPLYTLYPTLRNGLCDTFQSVELNSDEHVAERALSALEQHPSAESVVVYAGHRKVMTRARIHRDLAALLGRRRLELPTEA
ncbi:hypothetical protein [Phenylobacterium sp.]|uniref:hypothetical protein n=1 Tax=Phenylobacterium sp. TaxID=1871053 RepID=UPI0025CF7147|nr:hypothetical protein [Phenylobacterium sp.]